MKTLKKRKKKKGKLLKVESDGLESTKSNPWTRYARFN